MTCSAKATSTEKQETLITSIHTLLDIKRMMMNGLKCLSICIKKQVTLNARTLSARRSK